MAAVRGPVRHVMSDAGGAGEEGGGGELLCAVNLSEGRDAAVLDALAAVLGAARLLDLHADPDHHRAVFTLLGPAPAVRRDVLALARRAVALIDLGQHQGVHPRIGAVDVVPFVPVAGAAMALAVAAAHRVGEALAAEHELPVYFYGAAARRPERRELPDLRRGGPEGLAARLGDAAWQPDAGPARLHPTAGACAVGARGPLVAFNALLATDRVEPARAIAAAIRESAPGGLPRVRALGFFLERRGCAQVSMNLLEPRVTSPAAAAARVEAEARARGIAVRAWELVGCAPADAFADWPAGLAPLDLALRQLLPPALFA
jgi:glutamate formiminotransferase